jgi:hypothetical protein
MMKKLPIWIIASLTISLAPFSEPHILGKLS